MVFRNRSAVHSHIARRRRDTDPHGLQLPGSISRRVDGAHHHLFDIVSVFITPTPYALRARGAVGLCRANGNVPGRDSGTVRHAAADRLYLRIVDNTDRQADDDRRFVALSQGERVRLQGIPYAFGRAARTRIAHQQRPDLRRDIGASEASCQLHVLSVLSRRLVARTSACGPSASARSAAASAPPARAALARGEHSPPPAGCQHPQCATR